MNVALFVVCFVAFSYSFNTTHAQTRVLLGAKLGVTDFGRISAYDSQVGHSSGLSNVEKRPIAIPFVHVSRQLGKNTMIGTGLAYKKFTYDFRFRYFHDFSMTYVDKSFQLSASYLSIPVNTNLTLWSDDEGRFSLGIGGGMSVDLLVADENNYSDIIFEFINLKGANELRATVFSGQLQTYCQWKMLRTDVKLGLYYESGFSTLVGSKRLWGFYKRLESARAKSYGLSLGVFIS